VWFCVGPTSRLEGIENRTIIITNLADQPNEGLVTVVDNLGMWSERSIQLETGDRLELRTDQLVAEAQYAGVTIEAPHGGLLVEQQIAASNTAGQDRQLHHGHRTHRTNTLGNHRTARHPPSHTVPQPIPSRRRRGPHPAR